MSNDLATTPPVRIDDPRIPAIGSVPQPQRMMRVDWVANEHPGHDGTPVLDAAFVLRQGRAVRLVDLRDEQELTGPMGFIPGSDWIPRSDAVRVFETRDDKDEPTVLLCRDGESSRATARELRARGMRFVAAMRGGLEAWLKEGYGTTLVDRAPVARGALRALEPPQESERRLLTRDDVARHVGDPAQIRWEKLASLLVHGRLSCIDGRDGSAVVGSPGGDAGEFLVLLGALESVTGARFSEDAIEQLMLRRVRGLGRFYVHSDVAASNAFIGSMRRDDRLNEALSTVFEPLEWRRFMRSPPPEVREIILEHLDFETWGCGHLKLAAKHPAAYGVRTALVRGVLRSFFRLMWKGAPQLDYVVLPGGHGEGAVLLVHSDEALEPFSRLPLVPPRVAGVQVFVAHPPVTDYLRGQLARFAARQDDLVGRVDPADLGRAMVELGARQFNETAAALASGLPVFNVHLPERGTPRVEQA